MSKYISVVKGFCDNYLIEVRLSCRGNLNLSSRYKCSLLTCSHHPCHSKPPFFVNSRRSSGTTPSKITSNVFDLQHADVATYKLKPRTTSYTFTQNLKVFATEVKILPPLSYSVYIYHHFINPACWPELFVVAVSTTIPPFFDCVIYQLLVN